MKKVLKYALFGFIIFMFIGNMSAKAENYTCTYVIDENLESDVHGVDSNFGEAYKGKSMIVKVDGSTVDFSGFLAAFPNVTQSYLTTGNLSNNSTQNSFLRNNGGDTCPALHYFYKGGYELYFKFEAFGDDVTGGTRENPPITGTKTGGSAGQTPQGEEDIINTYCSKSVQVMLNDRRDIIFDDFTRVNISFGHAGESKKIKIKSNDGTYDTGWVNYNRGEFITLSRINFAVSDNDAKYYFSDDCGKTKIYLKTIFDGFNERNCQEALGSTTYSVYIQSLNPGSNYNASYCGHGGMDKGCGVDLCDHDDTVDKHYATSCDDAPETIKFIRQIYNLVKYLVPVLIILLSIVDFIKVVADGEEKIFKASFEKFVKRLIIGAIILILPSLLGLIIRMSGVLEAHNIGTTAKDIFCILK